MSDEIIGIDPGGEMSGGRFEPTDEASGNLGSLLGSVGSILGPAGVFTGGGMPPLDVSSRAESRAISGGDFSSGDIQFGKSDTLVIAAVIILGLVIVFWRK